jgi:hypothetical protein
MIDNTPQEIERMSVEELVTSLPTFGLLIVLPIGVAKWSVRYLQVQAFTFMAWLVLPLVATLPPQMRLGYITGLRSDRVQSMLLGYAKSSYGLRRVLQELGRRL